MPLLSPQPLYTPSWKDCCSLYIPLADLPPVAAAAFQHEAAALQAMRSMDHHNLFSKRSIKTKHCFTRIASHA